MTPRACLEKALPGVVERHGHHVARSAFDERTVGSQVSQMIYGGVDIQEIVARQSPCSAEAQPRRFDSTVFNRIRGMPRGFGFLIRHAMHVLKVALVGNSDRGSKKHSETWRATRQGEIRPKIRDAAAARAEQVPNVASNYQRKLL